MVHAPAQRCRDDPLPWSEPDALDQANRRVARGNSSGRIAATCPEPALLDPQVARELGSGGDPGSSDGYRLGARVPYLDPRMLVDPHDLEDSHDGGRQIEEDDGRPSICARAGKRQDHT